MKFGKKEHMEDLHNNGTLFLNDKSCFSTLKSVENRHRYDSFESINHVICREKIGFIELGSGVGKVSILPSDLAGSVLISFEDIVREKLFCMYALTARDIGSDYSVVIDDRVIHGFGDYCVLITDAEKFINRASKKALENKHVRRFIADRVEYVDTNQHHGDYGAFHKPSSYSYQSEFRIVVETTQEGPLTLQLGNLKDISILVPAELLLSDLKCTPRN